MTVSKPFSPELYGSDDNAKDLFIDILTARGWDAWVNPDQYGIDVLSTNLDGKPREFEVEVKHNWKGEYFAYKTLHYSNRKQKFLSNPDKVSFVNFNHERTHAFVVPGTVLANAKVITKDTIYTKGEQFIEVSVDDCKMIEVASYFRGI